MQQPLANSETTQVREVLSFSGAELQENIHGINKIAEIGVLYVLYFPQYNQFTLELNNWSYALLKQIPVTVSTKSQAESRCYIFPNESGFYIIKLRKIPHLEALQNFDTILSHNTTLKFFEDTTRSTEASPAYSTRHSGVSTPSSEQSEAIISAGKLRNREKIKKGFKKIASKLSGHYSTNQDNSNLVQARDYESLKCSGWEVPGGYLRKREYIESVIMNGKNIAETLNRRRKTADVRIEKCEKPKGDNNEFVDSSKRFMILDEIEKEKQLQNQEILLQEEHRRKELYYIEKERELLNLIRKQKEEELHQKEQLIMSEVIKRDSAIAQEAKNWESELLKFKENEKLLQTELQRNLSLIYEQEKLLEEERFHFGQREMELIQKSKQLELALADLESKQKELLKEPLVIEEQYQTSLSVLETKEIEIQNKQREISSLQAELEKRCNEIEERENDVGLQFIQILTRKDEIQKLIELRKNEVLELQCLKLEKGKRIEEQFNEIREKEDAFEIEQLQFQQKYSQFVEEIEYKRAELKEKEQRIEIDFVKAISTQEELKQSLKIKEEELLTITGQQERVQKENDLMEAKLSDQIEAIEKEIKKLEQKKEELLKAIQLQAEQLKNVKEKKKELLDEINQKMNTLTERKNKAEAELVQAQQKGQNLKNDLLRNLQELSEKERLKEEEHLELQKRLEELTMLENLGEVELKERSNSLDRLRSSKAQLVSKNVEIIQGHQILSQELEKMAEMIESIENKMIKKNTRTRKTKTIAVEDRNVENTNLERNSDNVTDLAGFDASNMNMAHYEA